jgi:LSD1 subclass zinc finger protein
MHVAALKAEHKGCMSTPRSNANISKAEAWVSSYRLQTQMKEYCASCRRILMLKEGFEKERRALASVVVDLLPSSLVPTRPVT